MPQKLTQRMIGVVAAFAGGAIGYWCVALFARQGFHAIVLPAALPGVLAGVLSKERSVWWAALYAAIGVFSALYAEWSFRPFIADASLAYFLRHVDDLQPIVDVIIAIGAVVGGVLAISFGRTPRNDSAGTTA